MNKYVIAKGYSLEEMAQQVNEYAAQGYTPCGELIKTRKLDDEGIAIKSEYMQPMWMQNAMVVKSIEEIKAMYKMPIRAPKSFPPESEFKAGMTLPAQPLNNVPSEHTIKRPQAVPEWQEREREYVEEIDRLNERIAAMSIDHTNALKNSFEQRRQIAANDVAANTLKKVAESRYIQIQQLDCQINTLTAELLAAKERISELDSALHNMAKLAANSTTKP